MPTDQEVKQTDLGMLCDSLKEQGISWVRGGDDTDIQIIVGNKVAHFNADGSHMDGVAAPVKAEVEWPRARVTKAALEANIVDTEIVKFVTKSGQVLRWAVLTTKNGFSVAGKPSCAVCSENDDAETGERIAIENSKDELWPLMGYELKSRLAA